MQEIKKEIVFLHVHFYVFSMCVCLMTGVVAIFGILDLGAWLIFGISLNTFFRHMLALTQSEQRLQNANETVLHLASFRDLSR